MPRSGGAADRSRTPAGGAKRKKPSAFPKKSWAARSAFSAARSAKYGAKRQKKGAKQSAASLIHMMNPFGKTYPPPGPTLGSFLCINDIARHAFTTSTSHDLLVVFNPNVRGLYQVNTWDQTGARDPYSYEFCPLYKYAPPAQAMEQYRPLRAGIKVKNLSPAQTRQGQLQVLVSDCPIDIPWSGSTLDVTSLGWAGLAATVTGAQKAKTITAESLSVGQPTFVSFATSLSQYHSYGQSGFDVSGTNPEIQATWNKTAHDMPMSVTLLLFPQTAVVQTYEIEVCVQHASKFAQNTVLGSLQKASSSNGSITEANDAVMANAGQPIHPLPGGPR